MKLTTSDEDKRNLINNRQNGRRRGRGSGAPRPNGSGNGQSGNRIDNRARGNASQLHEKYKTLARDAQMQGDRVLTEYYLQFADHYFRVLSETRARFDEQRRPQGQDDYGDGEGENAQNAGDDRDDIDGFDQPRYDQPRRDYRPEQQQRDQPRPQPRQDARPEPREDRDSRDARDNREPADSRDRERYAERSPRGRPRPDNGNGNRNGVANGSEGDGPAQADPEPRIEMDRLPPMLSVSLTSDDEAPAEEQPRVRRTRRPRSEAAPDAA